MERSSLIKRALASAVGVYAYIALLVFSVFNLGKIFGNREASWLGASLFLTVFVVSACITGTIVLLKPLTLYMDGHKKPALQLFGYTVVSLAAIALLVGLILIYKALPS